MGAFKDINIYFNFLEKDYGYFIANQIEKPAYDLFEYKNSKIGRSVLLEANIREDHFLFAIANTEVVQPNWEQDIWKQRNRSLVSRLSVNSSIRSRSHPSRSGADTIHHSVTCVYCSSGVRAVGFGARPPQPAV